MAYIPVITGPMFHERAEANKRLNDLMDEMKKILSKPQLTRGDLARLEQLVKEAKELADAYRLPTPDPVYYVALGVLDRARRGELKLAD